MIARFFQSEKLSEWQRTGKRLTVQDIAIAMQNASGNQELHDGSAYIVTNSVMDGHAPSPVQGRSATPTPDPVPNSRALRAFEDGGEAMNEAYFSGSGHQRKLVRAFEQCHVDASETPREEIQIKRAFYETGDKLQPHNEIDGIEVERSEEVPVQQVQTQEIVASSHGIEKVTVDELLSLEPKAVWILRLTEDGKTYTYRKFANPPVKQGRTPNDFQLCYSQCHISWESMRSLSKGTKVWISRSEIRPSVLPEHMEGKELRP